MIHNHWHRIMQKHYRLLIKLIFYSIRFQWLWIMVSYDEPVVVNHGVLCWASGYESWCVMLSQWLRSCQFRFEYINVLHNIHMRFLNCYTFLSEWYVCKKIDLVCYAEPVVMNHGVLCWASDCESWCAMLSQWLCIILCYAEPVVVNHDVLFCASGCESWCVKHTMIHNHWLSITHHDS
jgi:hypothetical protein